MNCFSLSLLLCSGLKSFHCLVLIIINFLKQRKIKEKQNLTATDIFWRSSKLLPWVEPIGDPVYFFHSRLLLTEPGHWLSARHKRTKGRCCAKIILLQNSISALFFQFSFLCLKLLGPFTWNLAQIRTVIFKIHSKEKFAWCCGSGESEKNVTLIVWGVRGSGWGDSHAKGREMLFISRLWV